VAAQCSGHFFLRQNPLWEPLAQFHSADGKFGMAELIRAARS